MSDQDNINNLPPEGDSPTHQPAVPLPENENPVPVVPVDANPMVHSVSEAPNNSDERERVVRNKRRTLRGKITRAINRIRLGIDGQQTTRRLLKQIEDLRVDYSQICECHNELYDFVDDSQIASLDEWENILVNEIYAIEEAVEDYAKLHSDQSTPGVVTRSVSARSVPLPVPSNPEPEPDVFEQPASVHDKIMPETGASNSVHSFGATQMDPTANMSTHEPSPRKLSDSEQGRFDEWIDDLIEFKETELIACMNSLSIADALYRLEASRDLPNVELPKFNGNALDYVEFVERFKIHVHNKPHLTDDVRIAQLKGHVRGEAERAISGLGSSGKMYATALKTIKQQFGQSSVIARACISKLTKGGNILSNDRQSLRDFSLDLINCRAMLVQIDYFSDVNANDTLRQIITRLPDHMIMQWKTHVTEIRERGEQPSIDHISKFVNKKVQAEFDPDFGNIQTGNKGQRSDVKFQKIRRGVHATSQQGYNRVLQCFICKDNHRVGNCPTFQDSSVDDRIDLVKENRLCFSCLTKGRMTKDCKAKGKCTKNGCTRLHHPLLHTDLPSVSGNSPLDKGSIMPVVRVNFRSPNGQIREGNVLVDSGAGTSIIRRDFAKSLGLQGKREGLSLAVVGGEQVEQPLSRRLKFWISPLKGGEEFEIEAHEIDKTIISVPALDRPWLNKFPHLSNLEYPHKAGPVDLILGVHYSHLHVEYEIRQGLPYQPVAKRTALGWYVMGSNQEQSNSICSVNFVQKVDMEKFYDFETLGVQAPNCNCPHSAISRDDQKAIELMEESCFKNEGRYTIGLPWKRNPEELPNNYPQAIKRLESTERSLLRNPTKAEMYQATISEYEEKGWSCKVTEDLMEIQPAYYLPHHGVYRPEKKTTPLRIVFDPSTPYMGTTLNNFLYKGPGLIGDLFGVLLRFREDIVAFTGDITKMYLQINLREEDTHVHRYLWRDLDVTKDPTVYRLLRVTFGAKPSPDMACYVILKIAEEYQESDPAVSVILRKDRYMDDIIHSCPDETTAIKRIKTLEKALDSGSFKVKEWYVCPPSIKKQLQSNSCQSEKSENLDQDKLESYSPEVNLDGQEVKTLGVVWKPDDDKLKFAVKQLHPKTFTKRMILSKMSTLYDPLGLAACVTVKARIAMQDIWRNKDYDWDDDLPAELVEKWISLFDDMQNLTSAEFPRCLKPHDAIGRPHLHVFSDASNKAYGAVAYLLWNRPTIPEVNLICAKARVAPLRHTTIPRLELMAALIASRLAKTIFEEFKEKPETITLWTDAQIVLHWLRSESINMKPFVGVRIAEIQTTWGPEYWKFVPTNVNPADDISRGISSTDMQHRWMHGPEFLKETPESWPVEPTQLVQDKTEFKTLKVVSTVQRVPSFINASDYSTWTRLIRVTAFCFRFIHNLRCSINERRSEESLQCDGITEAKSYWIKKAQEDLENWKLLSDLNPFVESEIIRVGGRLKKSKLSYDQIHPILLPSDNHISTLLMKHIHDKSCHGGIERTLCDSRREFWILRGRRLSKRIVGKCTICRKLREPPHKTLMGDLPADRMKPFEPVFSVTGVDLFGPFFLRYGRNKQKKAWGAIFTCASSRAIHLEIVDGLSTEAFLQSLRRFAAHHGWPHTVISDNGTSFVGARKELKVLVEEGKKHLQDFATLHQVKWKFITPLSPHQGGFYESLIKQVKRAISTAVGSQVLTWAEMSTVFAEAESLVNSRPVGYASNNPNDIQPLTPNHFIMGRATPSVPQGPFQETKNPRKRFQFIQMLVQQFWNRFVREYVPTLMKRSKWQREGRQMKVNDIVLLMEPNVARGNWKLGRVIEVYPGTDGIVRNIKVKTQFGEYKRSVQKCCPILEQ